MQTEDIINFLKRNAEPFLFLSNPMIIMKRPFTENVPFSNVI